MVYVEETPFEAKRVLVDAIARCYLEATASFFSGVAQAATAAELKSSSS
jgi:hypothetical protein